MILNVEKITLAAGDNYKLTTYDATVTVRKTLTVDGSALGAGDKLTFNSTAERDGSFVVTGGAGDDVLSGGDSNGISAITDAFNLQHGGDDSVTGGGQCDKHRQFWRRVYRCRQGPGQRGCFWEHDHRSER
jgi:hypothetical protein